MIDYLELLLERQEREEPGETLEWARNAAVPAVRKRMAEGGGADGVFQAGAGPVLPARTADSAAWTAGITAPKAGVLDVRAGVRTGPGGTGEPEAAGVDLYEGADAEAPWTQGESGGAPALFRARETALPVGAGGPARSGAPGLYRQMARTGQAAVGLRYSTRLVTVAESASPSPGLGAEELDELFSRDARRYDGGFSLF